MEEAITVATTADTEATDITMEDIIDATEDTDGTEAVIPRGGSRHLYFLLGIIAQVTGINWALS